MSSVIYTLSAFLITYIIEFVITFLFIRKPLAKILIYSFLVNLLTWPLAQYFVGYTGILLMEFLVFLTESVLIKILFEIKYGKAVLISLTANLVSFLLGFIIFMFI